MQRIHRNYRFIVGFNAGLIALGVGGIIQQQHLLCYIIRLLCILD